MRPSVSLAALRERNLALIVWLGSVALNPIGYALVGPLAGQIHVAETLYLAAAINAGVSLVVAMVPSIRHLHAEPRPVPAT